MQVLPRHASVGEERGRGRECWRERTGRRARKGEQTVCVGVSEAWAKRGRSVSVGVTEP